ncbi:MAG: 4-(cytidine 5'-diphospho)-2-C-methyl-D-erythritol kinase [Arenicellales bacterium WSBS_2016_MAG_OTU3]
MAAIKYSQTENSNRKIWLAPAKLNLCLHVVNQRDDGYHELQSLVQFISLYDELTFLITQDGNIKRIGNDGLPKQDLCVRAAMRLQQATGVRFGVQISLKKNIPIGAGLGGGSSDAATTLIALNKLWETNLSRDQLAEIGLKLGADVPLFVQGQNVLVEGIGERLTPINLPETTFCVIVPQIHVSTPQIYADLQLTRDTPVKTIRQLLDGYAESNSGQSPNSVFRNDLEPVTCRHHVEVGLIVEWLQQFGEARMSGSGGAVFAETSSIGDADKLCAHLANCKLASAHRVGSRGFSVSGIKQHPHWNTNLGR